MSERDQRWGEGGAFGGVATRSRTRGGMGGVRAGGLPVGAAPGRETLRQGNKCWQSPAPAGGAAGPLGTPSPVIQCLLLSLLLVVGPAVFSI